jgi:hypothetical protein
MLKQLLYACGVALTVSACVAAPTQRDYSAFRSESPRSILVVPALNNTVSVEAAENFLSTVSRPFAERGYYVFPAYMVKSLLDQDGLSDAGLVHATDARRLERLFGCDAVLYITIEKWETQYVVIAASTNVAFNYTLKSCKTGQELWASQQAMSYSPSQSNSGNPMADLIAQAVVAAIQKAAPNYLPLAQKANALAAGAVGYGLPAGPYLPALYRKDIEQFPAQAVPTQPARVITEPGVVSGR